MQLSQIETIDAPTATTGVLILPTQTRHYEGGNPSKLPNTFALFDPLIPLWFKGGRSDMVHWFFSDQVEYRSPLGAPIGSTPW